MQSVAPDEFEVFRRLRDADPDAFRVVRVLAERVCGGVPQYGKLDLAKERIVELEKQRDDGVTGDPQPANSDTTDVEPDWIVERVRSAIKSSYEDLELLKGPFLAVSFRDMAERAIAELRRVDKEREASGNMEGRGIMSTVTCYVGTTTITCELQEAPKTPKAFGDIVAAVWRLAFDAEPTALCSNITNVDVGMNQVTVHLCIPEGTKANELHNTRALIDAAVRRHVAGSSHKGVPAAASRHVLDSNGRYASVQRCNARPCAVCHRRCSCARALPRLGLGVTPSPESMPNTPIRK